MTDRPILFCPFDDVPAHPRATALAERAYGWASEHALLPDSGPATRRKVESYAGLTSRCYPDAPYERVAAICDYVSWLFYFDDACESISLGGGAPRDVARFLRDVFGILEGSPVTQTHTRTSMFALALADIWRRIAVAMPGAWQRRFVRNVHCYIEGCVWEAENRLQDRVPSRGVFQSMRMHTSTLNEFWDLMEYAGDYVLPDPVLEHPLVAELTRTGNAIASYANDIYSLRKETENRDFHNLVIVLEADERVTRSEAMRRAGMVHDAQVRHWLALERSLPSFGIETDRDLARYLRGMRTWMRANHDWSTVTPRYNAEPVGEAPR